MLLVCNWQKVDGDQNCRLYVLLGCELQTEFSNCISISTVCMLCHSSGFTPSNFFRVTSLSLLTTLLDEIIQLRQSLILSKVCSVTSNIDGVRAHRYIAEAARILYLYLRLPVSGKHKSKTLDALEKT